VENSAGLLASVRDLPQHGLTVPLRSPRGRFERSFRGALLYDYAKTAGLLPEGTSEVTLGNCYFRIEANDGARITLAFAEVSPLYTEKQVLLAWEQDGEALRSGLRLVVPGDDLGGRSIAGVVRIDLIAAETTAGDDAKRQPSSRAEIGGLLDHPASLSRAELAALDAVEVQTPALPHHHGVEPGKRYAGPLLWGLLDAAGIQLDASVNEDILRKVIVATSTDGFASVIAAGEIEPRFMNGQAIVATACEGAPLTEAEGGIRLILPFDRSIRRSVKALARIEIREG
jgi:hypothetical protein